MADEYVKGISNIIDHCEIKPGERVLVFAEYNSDRDVAETLLRLALEKGGDASLIYSQPLAIGGSSEPSEIARQALLACELVIVSSTYALLHTKTLFEGFLERGVRCMEISGDMATKETLSSPGALMPRQVFYAVTYYIAEKFFGEKEVRLTSKRGTDFTCYSPPGGLYQGWGGTGRARPLLPGAFQTPPWSSEGTFWPRETGNGVIYFDGFYGTGYSEDPIICTFENGWCHKIESGGPKSKAEQVKTFINQYKYANHCTEFGMGVNPKGRVPLKESDKTLIEAQRNCGVIHIGFGSRRVGNPPLGHPEYLSRVHIDGTVLDPTVAVEGETLIEDGVPIYLKDPVLRDMVKEWGDPDELLKYERNVIF